MMVYFCFDDDETSGRDKLAMALAECPTTKAAYSNDQNDSDSVPATESTQDQESTENDQDIVQPKSNLDVFLERVNTTNQSKFVRKSFVLR